MAAEGKEVHNDRGQLMRMVTSSDVADGTTVWYHSDSDNTWCCGHMTSPDVATPLVQENTDKVYVVCPPKVMGYAHIRKLWLVREVESKELPGEENRKQEASDEGNSLPAVGGVAEETLDGTTCTTYVTNVIAWLEKLLKDSKSKGKTLAKLFADTVHSHQADKEVLRDDFKRLIPWNCSGYLNFQSAPKTGKQGQVHASFLAFDQEAYPGNGMYVQDSIVLLGSTSLSSLMAKTIELRLVSGAKPATFGWMADGAVINGSLCFMFSALVMYAVLHNEILPQPLARALSCIKALYKNHSNTQQRICSSLIESQAQRYANRSAYDVFYLAAEFNRNCCDHNMARAVVKLYRQRTVLKRQLAMPARVEDAVVRVMSPAKVADGTSSRAAQTSSYWGWDDGPFTASLLLAPCFAIGSSLTDSCHEEYAKMCTQTVEGQFLAMTMYCDAFDAKPQRLSDEAWNELCIACGLWAQIRSKVLPVLSFGDEDIEAVDKEFKEVEALMKCVAGLVCKEPEPAVGGKALLQWIVNQIPKLKNFMSTKQQRLQDTANNSAAMLLATDEAKQLTVATYLSSIALDVHSYETAIESLKEENASMETKWEGLRKLHVDDVQRFQNAMQGSDAVFWTPESRKKLSQNKSWLHSAVGEAMENRKRLKTILGVKDDDIFQVNVFPLYTMGTCKKQFVEQVKQVLPKLKGITLVFYPIMARNTHRKPSSMVVEGVQGAANGADDAGSDMDVDIHDFGDDGELLPDTVTQVSAISSSNEKAAQLAADHLEIDSLLGLAEIKVRYLKRLHFLHTKDSYGEGEVSTGMVLLPTEDTAGISLDALKESILCQSGMYQAVPLASSFLLVNKASARAAKRAMTDNWRYDKEILRDASQRFAASKVSRCQLGVELHKEWVKDLVKTCGKKCMLVNDFHHGSAEVMKACLDVKVSEEATAQGVRLCGWSHDPRSVFFEAGRARGRTHMGSLYLKRKLTMVGHQPVEDPGEKPKKSRKLLRALMTQPMKVLSLSADGDLIIPDEQETKIACNAVLEDEAADTIDKIRKKYPRPSQLPTVDTTETKPNPNPNPAVVVKAGTCFPSASEVTEKCGDKILKSSPLPGVAAAIYKKAEFVLASKADGKGFRVWLHDLSGSDLSLPPNLYLGEVGPGAFKSIATDPLTPEQQPYAWRFTRHTSHKRDSSEVGNAYMSYFPDPTAPPADGGKPKLFTMEDIEKEVGSQLGLYGHNVTRGAGKTKVTLTPSPAPVVYVPANTGTASPESFSHKTLGSFLPSQESVSGATLKLDGYARPVFEVIVAQGSQQGASSSSSSISKVIKPMNVNGRNSAHLFTSRKIDIPANGYFAMNP